MWALWVCAALAQDFRAWQGLYEGMLQESSEGDTAKAIRWYDGLISGLPPGDATLGALHLQLGRTLYMVGDVDAARMHLALASGHDEVALRALALTGQIDAQEIRVGVLPYAEDYADASTAWLHAWQYGAKGSVGIEGQGDSATLRWLTEVSPREDDQIHLWLEPGIQPKALSMRLSAEGYPAYLMVVLIDDQGRWFALNDIVYAEPDQWAELNAELKDFSLVAPEGGTSALATHPTNVRLIVLRDLSTFYTSDLGPHAVLLDDFSLR